MYQRNQISVLYYLFYVLVILYYLMTSISITSFFIKDDVDGMHWVYPGFSMLGGRDLSFSTLVHIKVAYVILLSFVYMQLIGGRFLKLRKQHNVRKLTAGNIFFGPNTSRCRQLISKLLIAILTLNFLLIAIVNPSMLNPGPQNLSVYYQNVQGLIPFSSLSNTHPSLNRTKILELNTYINVEKPAVVTSYKILVYIIASSTRYS